MSDVLTKTMAQECYDIMDDLLKAYKKYISVLEPFIDRIR